MSNIKIDIQRLRNLTTGRLHTKIDHVYEDLGLLTDESGLMTHMLPRVLRAVEPWLRANVKDKRFWNDEWDTTHVGEFDLPIPSEEDRAAFLQRYKAMPDPLVGKDVVVVAVND